MAALYSFAPHQKPSTEISRRRCRTRKCSLTFNIIIRLLNIFLFLTLFYFRINNIPEESTSRTRLPLQIVVRVVHLAFSTGTSVNYIVNSVFSSILGSIPILRKDPVFELLRREPFDVVSIQTRKSYPSFVKFLMNSL